MIVSHKYHPSSRIGIKGTPFPKVEKFRFLGSTITSMNNERITELFSVSNLFKFQKKGIQSSQKVISYKAWISETNPHARKKCLKIWETNPFQDDRKIRMYGSEVLIKNFLWKAFNDMNDSWYEGKEVKRRREDLWIRAIHPNLYRK